MGYYKLLSWLMDNSIGGCLLIVGVLILRKVLKGRLNPRVYIGLWSVLLFKLTVPYRFNINLNAIMSMIFGRENIHKYAINTTGIDSLGAPVASYIRIIPNQDQVGYNPWSLLAVIWLAVVIILSTRLILNSLRFNRLMSEASLCDDSRILSIYTRAQRSLDISEYIPLVETSLAISPALYGVFSPRIIIPSASLREMSGEELYYIFLHELTHYKRRDLYLVLYTKALKIFYWFNPFIAYGMDKLTEDIELVCDNIVISRIGRDNRQYYGHTLIKQFTLFKDFSSRGYVPACNFFSKKILKRRIEMISKYKGFSKKGIALMLLMVMGLGLMFLTTPKSDALNNSIESNVDISVGTDENVKDPVAVPLAVEDVEDDEAPVYAWPLKDKYLITSPYGERVHPVLKKVKIHTGIDLSAKEGTDVLAARGGIVAKSENIGVYGNVVILEHGDGITTMYAHCSELLVEAGDTVEIGQVIAKTGSTGLATGPHLHFEIQKNGEHFDPLSDEILGKMRKINTAE